MKIFYICRVFSGLKQSILNKKWSPSGVPTIYKIIERLDKSKHTIKFVFTDWISNKNETSISIEKAEINFKFKNFKSQFTMINGKNFFNFLINKKLISLATEIRRQLILVIKIIRFNPDIVYVDRANLLTGAICSRFLKKKVVLRIMGIYPSMWEVLNKENLFNKFYRWCLKSKFSFVICTEDGTGGIKWMNEALNNSVNRISLLNGVDKTKNNKKNLISKQKLKKRISILYKGRLEKIKGCYEFINAISLIDASLKNKINIILVGSGTEEKELLELVKRKKLCKNFFHLKDVAHKDIFSLNKIADIYVSLNKAGNLSNSNLECFLGGICSIIPEERESFSYDTIIKKYFNEEELIRIPWKNQEYYLSQKLNELIKSRNKITYFSKNLALKSQKIIKPWYIRIDKEIKILEKINE